MTLFNKKCANTMMEQNKQPKGCIVDGKTFAGYGRWNPIFHGYEFPLDSFLQDNKIACKKWSFDNTSIIYEQFMNCKRIYAYYATLEELFHSNSPYIQLFDQRKVKSALEKNGQCEYIEDGHNHYRIVIKLNKKDIH